MSFRQSTWTTLKKLETEKDQISNSDLKCEQAFARKSEPEKAVTSYPCAFVRVYRQMWMDTKWSRCACVGVFMHKAICLNVMKCEIYLPSEYTQIDIYSTDSTLLPLLFVLQGYCLR